MKWKGRKQVDGPMVFMVLFLVLVWCTAAAPARADTVSADVFGKQGNRPHLVLGLAGGYTDNIRNTDTNKLDDTLAVISPGAWFALPRLEQAPLGADTASQMPGGLVLPRLGPESFERLRAYLLYGSDFIRYQDHSEENTANHRLEGFVQYNFPMGLSAEIGNQYSRAHDLRGNGISTELDEFATNLVRCGLSYEIGERFKVRGTYRNFAVDYRAGRNRDRDRLDNTLTAALFFKASAKTSFFTAYRWTDVDYDSDVNPDSREHDLSLGLQYRITDKSRGRVQAGYGIKDFADPMIANSEEFSFGLRVQHDFTTRTGMEIRGFRRTEETSVSSIDYIVTSHLGALVRHRFNSRLTARLEGSYTRDRYAGPFVYNGQAGERRDTFLAIQPSLEYQFRRWLALETSYSYLERDSNFAVYSYRTNTVWARLRFVL